MSPHRAFSDSNVPRDSPGEERMAKIKAQESTVSNMLGWKAQEEGTRALMRESSWYRNGFCGSGAVFWVIKARVL